VDGHTGHPRGVSAILETLRAQVLGALALPFFDGESWHEVSPVVKAGVAEAGTVHVAARHIDPPYSADVTLDVRTDLEAPGDARYQIRGRCAMSREGISERRDFGLGVTIDDDGLVTLDSAHLRAEMAEAIRLLDLLR
jgi:hypothetical protein